MRYGPRAENFVWLRLKAQSVISLGYIHEGGNNKGRDLSKVSGIVQAEVDSSATSLEANHEQVAHLDRTSS